MSGVGGGELPVRSDGSTYADETWWLGKPEHEAPQTPANMDEAEALTWARCWAYGEAKGMSTREWHLMWPIVYAALHACRTAVENITAARTTDLATAWQDGYNAAKGHLRWEDEPVNPWVGEGK